jgi:hypothetical protein
MAAVLAKVAIDLNMIIRDAIEEAVRGAVLNDLHGVYLDDTTIAVLADRIDNRFLVALEEKGVRI